MGVTVHAHQVIEWRDFSPAAALNLHTSDAGMSIVAPVDGLRPWRAGFMAPLNVPKPGHVTLSLALATPVTASNSAPTTFSAVAASTPDRSATAADQLGFGHIYLP